MMHVAAGIRASLSLVRMSACCVDGQKQAPPVDEQDEDDDGEEDMARIMGFQGFGAAVESRVEKHDRESKILENAAKTSFARVEERAHQSQDDSRTSHDDDKPSKEFEEAVRNKKKKQSKPQSDEEDLDDEDEDGDGLVRACDDCLHLLAVAFSLSLSLCLSVSVSVSSSSSRC